MTEFTECKECGKSIMVNERYYLVLYQVEIYDGEAIEVLDSNDIETFCTKCAEKKAFWKIVTPNK